MAGKEHDKSSVGLRTGAGDDECVETGDGRRTRRALDKSDVGGENDAVVGAGEE